MSPLELQEARRQIEELLAKGYIQPSKSPYGAPILFTKKKNGGLRLCIDYKGLNSITKRNSYNLPRIDELLEGLAGARFFSKLDLASGYHQIRVAPEDVEKTAFNSSGSREQHLEQLRRVLQRLREHQLYAQTSKLGAVLQQDHGQGLQPVAYFSKKLKGAELNWTTSEKETLARVLAVKNWRCFLEGVEFSLQTDHCPLIYLQTQPNLSRKQARWLEFFQQFSFKVEYIQGKHNCVADALSRVQLNLLTTTLQLQEEWLQEIRNALDQDEEAQQARKEMQQGMMEWTEQEGLLWFQAMRGLSEIEDSTATKSRTSSIAAHTTPTMGAGDDGLRHRSAKDQGWQGCYTETDGATERANQTVETMLRAFVSDQQDQWDKYLSIVEFAYNSSTNAATKVQQQARQQALLAQNQQEQTANRHRRDENFQAHACMTSSTSRYSSGSMVTHLQNLHQSGQKTLRNSKWRELFDTGWYGDNYSFWSFGWATLWKMLRGSQR